jgi:hypothetical protein
MYPSGEVPRALTAQMAVGCVEVSVWAKLVSQLAVIVARKTVSNMRGCSKRRSTDTLFV